MRRQGKAWLAAGVLALGVAGCFSDPTSGLRNGPVSLEFTNAGGTGAAGINFLAMTSGRDTVNLSVRVLDQQGNALAFDMDTVNGYASSAPAIVGIKPLPDPVLRNVPGNTTTKAIVYGVDPNGGVAYVRVTAAGLTDSIKVISTPKKLTGAAVTGTTGADTVAGTTNYVYTAGDTMVLNSTPQTTFTATSKVIFSVLDTGYIVTRTATQIKALSHKAHAGPVTVTNLSFTSGGTTIAMASLLTDSVNLQHARFRGAAAVAVSAFGPNTQLTVTAQAGTTFNTTTSAITVGGTAAIMLGRTATTLTGIIPGTVTGYVMVQIVNIGTAVIDSLRAGSVANPPITVNASFFPVAVVNGALHQLLDTVVIDTTGCGCGATFAANAMVYVGPNGGTDRHDSLFVISKSSSKITGIARHGGTYAVRVSNVIVGGSTIPSLQTQNPVVVDSVTTGEPNEPGNQASATATPIVGIVNIGDSVFVYGAMDGQADQRDYYTLTMPAAGGKIAVSMLFFGNGSGVSDMDPDFDIVVCTTLSGAGSCTYTQDLIPNNGASLTNNPEAGTTTAIAGAAAVFIRTYSYYATGNAGEHAYRLKVKATP